MPCHRDAEHFATRCARGCPRRGRNSRAARECRRHAPAAAARSASSRRDQQMPRLGDEGVADAAAFLGADRDVLQIGIVRRQPPGRGDRLRVAGVHAPGVRIDLVRPAHRHRWTSASATAANPGCAPAVRVPGRPASAAPTHRCPRRRSSSACRRASFISSNSTSPSCFGEPTLNARPGEAMDVAFDHRHALLEIDRHARADRRRPP